MKLLLTQEEVKFLKKEISKDFIVIGSIFNTSQLKEVVEKLSEENDYTEQELDYLGEWLSFHIDSHGWSTKKGKAIEPILNKVNKLVWG